MHFICNCFIICLTICLIVIKGQLVCNDESDHKMDHIFMEMSTFGDPKGRYPANQFQMNNDCKRDKSHIQWLKAYMDGCLKEATYDVTSMAINDLEIVVKKYCDSPKLSKLYISWANCGNSAINGTNKCWQRYILDMQRMDQERERILDRDRVGVICCAYHRFDTCVEESLISEGADRCTTANVEGLHSMLTEMSGRMIENFCGDYQIDNDKCDSLTNGYKDLNDIELKEPLRKSPLNSFIKLIDNTPEFIRFMKTSLNKTF